MFTPSLHLSLLLAIGRIGHVVYLLARPGARTNWMFEGMLLIHTYDKMGPLVFGWRSAIRPRAHGSEAR